jgi:hypothetical protein
MVYLMHIKLSVLQHKLFYAYCMDNRIYTHTGNAEKKIFAYNNFISICLKLVCSKRFFY